MILPCVRSFPADFLPEQPDASGEYRLPETLRLTGGHSAPLRIVEIQKETEEILKHYWRRMDGGDRTALAELLDKNPAFILVPWVAESSLRITANRLSLRRRGRPKRYKQNPLIIAGLVEFLLGKQLTLPAAPEHGIRSKILQIRNPETAFQALAELGVFDYEQAKRGYYRARQNKYIRAIMLTNANDLPVPSIQQLEATNARAMEKYGREKKSFAVIKRASVYTINPGEDMTPMSVDGTCKIYAVNEGTETKLGELKLDM